MGQCLSDGRRISVPLAWSWRPSDATPERRGNYRLVANGIGVDWPDVDEDISVKGTLHGSPAKPPRQMAWKGPITASHNPAEHRSAGVFLFLFQFLTPDIGTARSGCRWLYELLLPGRRLNRRSILLRAEARFLVHLLDRFHLRQFR